MTSNWIKVTKKIWGAAQPADQNLSSCDIFLKICSSLLLLVLSSKVVADWDVITASAKSEGFQELRKK